MMARTRTSAAMRTRRGATVAASSNVRRTASPRPAMGDGANVEATRTLATRLVASGIAAGPAVVMRTTLSAGRLTAGAALTAVTGDGSDAIVGVATAGRT